MESTLELIHNLQTWESTCIFVAIVFGAMFIVAFALACYYMSKKRSRRPEGLATFFTTIAAAALVFSLVPSTGAMICRLQGVVAEQRWAHEVLTSVENEQGIRLNGQERDNEKAHLIDQMRSGNDVALIRQELEESISSSN